MEPQKMPNRQSNPEEEGEAEGITILTSNYTTIIIT